MTVNRLGVLAFGVLGTYILVTTAAELVRGIPWFFLEPGEAAYQEFTWSLYSVLTAVVGLGFVRFRTELATWLFGRDELEVGGASLWDIQVAGLALLGAWLIVSGAPRLVLDVVYQSHTQRATVPLGLAETWIGNYLEAGVQILGGVLLIRKASWVAGLWCPQPEAERPS